MPIRLPIRRKRGDAPRRGEALLPMGDVVSDGAPHPAEDDGTSPQDAARPEEAPAQAGDDPGRIAGGRLG